MPDLKRYIADHREEFDGQEPDPGHFSRFGKLLDNQPAVHQPPANRPMLLKVAALILLMITVSVFLFDMASREIRERFAGEKSVAELPLEIREAMQYYDNQATNNLGTIQKLAANSREAGLVNESARVEIQALDAATAELKKQLADSPGNERILEAIIQNQQMKESVLQTIIKQVSQKK